jgi:hypothetical protein
MGSLHARPVEEPGNRRFFRLSALCESPAPPFFGSSFGVLKPRSLPRAGSVVNLCLYNYLASKKARGNMVFYSRLTRFRVREVVLPDGVLNAKSYKGGTYLRRLPHPSLHGQPFSRSGGRHSDAWGQL